MKKNIIINSVIILLMFLLINTTITSAATTNNPEGKPIADIYTEGIYKFTTGPGSKMTFELLTQDKPITFILYDSVDKEVKYMFKLDNNTKRIEVDLAKPVGSHIGIVIGDGEMAFTYED